MTAALPGRSVLPTAAAEARRMVEPSGPMAIRAAARCVRLMVAARTIQPVGHRKAKFAISSATAMAATATVATSIEATVTVATLIVVTATVVTSIVVIVGTAVIVIEA